MATGAYNSQVAPAQQSGKVQPQTTVEPPGGPFIRHSQSGRRAGYTVSSVAFGGQVTQPLPSSPGYVKGFRYNITAGGGVNGTNTVAVTADAPFNCVSLIQMKDAFGNPIMVGPGYEMLYLVPLFSGGFGLFDAADLKNLPSYSAPSVGASGTGDFGFSGYLPLEFVKGYGTISGANAALQMTLQWNLAASATVYSTAPGTLPTNTIRLDPDFYWLPEGNTVEPPGLGTSRQWIVQAANPTIGSAASQRVQFPRLGGYIDTFILVLRDSTGARIDAWPTRLQLYVDGVPLVDSTVTDIEDDMYNQFGGITRPTGVLAFTRKNSLSQINLGLLDTGETYLSTNPGTLVEVGGYPWGSITNSPATLSIIAGQVVPSGSLIQGLPEV